MNCIQKTNKEMFGWVDNIFSKEGCKNLAFSVFLIACVGGASSLLVYVMEILKENQFPGVAILVLMVGLVIVLACSIVYLVTLFGNCNEESSSDA